MNDRAPATVEGPGSWRIAIVALATLAVSFGSPYVAVVALKAIAAEVGGQRSVPALATSLAWFGAAIGGLAMGPLAERIGVRWTAMFGATMIAAGLALSAQGEIWQLYVGHGLFIGLLGNAGINAPLYIYVTRWFDRRRGAALALISSGQYVAGAFWPPIFEQAIAVVGWRQTMLLYGLAVAGIVVPLAAIFFKRPPEAAPLTPAAAAAAPMAGAPVLGMPPNLVFGLLVVANFLCCVPMAMPSGHIIALCGDLGMTAGRGATMLSVLLVCAVVSRQLWGALSDRIGGLKTILLSSLAQAVCVAGFSATQSEAGLFAVAAAFGLGFSGLIPAYVLAIREYFPAGEASWRVPATLLFGGSGMATGGWLAGYIYDGAGAYAPAFATGLVFNLANLGVVVFLVLRARRYKGRSMPMLRPAAA